MKNGSISTQSRKKQRIDKWKEIVSELNSDEKEELARLSLPSTIPTLHGVDGNDLAEDDGALLQSGEKDEFENDKVLTMESMEDYKEKQEVQLTWMKEGDKDDLTRAVCSK